MPDIPEEILEHYEGYNEQQRLSSGDGQLEAARTRVIIARYLAPAPAIVADVGGAAGVYAHWLARRGYTVHLRDVVPRHIEQALATASPDRPLASAAVADARALDLESASVDAVLLLGPLYHLTGRADRLAALHEAGRILKPGGVLLGAAISRYASALDGLWRDLLSDPAFGPIVDRGLATGQHRNPTDDPTYFTTAYFHRPADLASELTEAGYADVEVLPVEGIGWIIPDFDSRWADEAARQPILDLIERTEGVPELLGVSQHLLAIGRRLSY